MREKVIQASMKYLNHRSYSHILDLSSEEDCDLCIASFDEEANEVSICSIGYKHANKEPDFDDGYHTCEWYEKKLVKAMQLDFVDISDTPIRFDHICMLVLGESRALIRHHQNILAAFEEGNEND